MMRGTVYHCPATEFQRKTYLIGSESGVMEEWADDVTMVNARCRRFADVQLTEPPIRAKIDGAWVNVWLHDHVVRKTGCLDIPEEIIAYATDQVYEVLFVYNRENLHLKDLSAADVARVRRWFHKLIKWSPVDPSHTLQPCAERTAGETQSDPPAYPCTTVSMLVETAQTVAEEHPPRGSTPVPTTTQIST